MENYWDAKRLVREYVAISRMLSWNQDNTFRKIPWSDQIRIKRVAAVVCAYNGKPLKKRDPRTVLNELPGFWGNEDFFSHSAISNENVLKLKTMFQSVIDSDSKHFQSVWENFENNSIDRNALFRMLFKFRIETEGLLTCFSGILCAPSGGIMGYQMIKNLYFGSIEQKNELLDEMMALLLGDKFTASFTEEELREKYNYPKETDRELRDWEIDNF